MSQLNLVNLEQATKLKELGFDWEVELYFYKGHPNKSKLWNRNLYQDQCSRPTVELALKWLRNAMRFPIVILGTSKPELYHIAYQDTNTHWSILKNDAGITLYLRYEEAQSTGLDYALNHLLTQNK